MRNLQEVLLEKETALLRVRNEVEALRFVAPLLFESDDQNGNPAKNRWPLDVEDIPQASTGQ